MLNKRDMLYKIDMLNRYIYGIYICLKKINNIFNYIYSLKNIAKEKYYHNVIFQIFIILDISAVFIKKHKIMCIYHFYHLSVCF